MALYRAVVEVFVAYSGRLPLMRLKNPEAGMLIGPALTVKLSPISRTEGCLIQYPNAEARYKIIDSVRLKPKASIIQLPEEKEVAMEVIEQNEFSEDYDVRGDSQRETKQDSLTGTDVFDTVTASLEPDYFAEPSETDRHTEGLPNYTIESLREQIASFNKCWRRVSLANPTIKLAVSIFKASRS